MQKRKLSTSEKVLLGVLAALIVIVIGLGAFLIIRNVNAANEEAAKLTSGTTVETTTTASTTKSKTSDSKTSSKTKSSKTSGSSSGSLSDPAASSGTSSTTSSKTSSKTTSSKTSSKSKVKGDKIERVTPKENTSHASKKTLKINGKTCYVGDTIKATLDLTSQKSIINYQGTLSFDNNYLEIKDVKANGLCVANKTDKSVEYNASTLSGMDFSETGTIFTVTFKVKEAGSTKISNELEIISELVDNNIRQLEETEYNVKVNIYS